MGTRAIPDHSDARKRLDSTVAAVLADSASESYDTVFNTIIDGGVLPVAVTTEINGKTTGSKTLYTVPTGYRFYCTKVLFRVSAATSANGDMAGQLRANTTAIGSSTTFTGLNATGEEWALLVSGLNTPVSAGETLNLNVTTADTGTAITLMALVYGFLSEV